MIIYKATNKVNGKYYIGQTTYPLARRKSMHKKRALSSYEQGRNSYFYNAIRKYGFDSFDWEIVAEASSQEELDRLEAKFISEIPEGMSYNMMPGGRFNPMDDEGLRLRQSEIVQKVGDRISNTMKAYYNSADDTARRQGISKSMKGNKNGNKYLIVVYDKETDEELEFDSYVSAGAHIGVCGAAVRQHWDRVKVGGGDYMKHRYRVIDVIDKCAPDIIAVDAAGSEHRFKDLEEAIEKLGLASDTATKNAIHRALREQATSRGYKWLEDKR